MIRPQFSLDLSDELIVDNFAGGGGASTGIELALGRHVDIAINHDPEAVSLHSANHPQTRHFCESVWDVDPVESCAGRPVGLAWFSPDCKHFSKAKGGKPRSKKIRGLAWIVLKWVQAVRPRVIMLENVEEFQTWCPVKADGMVSTWRKQWFFRCFVGALRRRGYEVDWKELRACDYGAPTIRKRLFLIARCDGKPIVWPVPTHGPSTKQPYRTAAECIDWSIPCPSIFTRERPLAKATLRRIAKGIMRYVVNARNPFIVPLTHQGADRAYPISEPFRTVTGAHRGEMALVSPVLTECSNASSPRCMPAGEPMRTVCAETKGGHHALVAAHLTKFRTGSTGSDMAEPMHTITAGPKENPAGAPHAMGVVTAFLAKHFTGVVGSDVRDPVATVTATDHHSVVAATLMRQFGTSNAADIAAPLGTVMADGGGKTGLVQAFLIKYYGADQDPRLNDPLHTVTARDRFGLVTVAGEQYAITDIGLRMLQPRELYRAQGFPESYIIGDKPEQGLTLTKSAQVRMCGNSVCPPMAAALVRANVPELAAWSSDELKHQPALVA